ncbi:MAG: hypothetical protein HY286_11485 [Planctomycetes bacterium]|nr:hypothetical protein [Planctomycetota bacterium]
MDTLGCVSALLALAARVFSSARLLKNLGVELENRPVVLIIMILIFSALGVVLGLFGYHKDWPRWANGRAITAIFVGALILIITLLEIAARPAGAGSIPVQR